MRLLKCACRQELMAPPLSCLLPPAPPPLCTSCLILTGLELELESGSWKQGLKVDGWTQMERERNGATRKEGSSMPEGVTLTIP